MSTMAVDGANDTALVVIKERNVDCPGNTPCQKFSGRTDIDYLMAAGQCLLKLYRLR